MYEVHYEGKNLGIFKAPTEEKAKRDAWCAAGYPCWKYSSAIPSLFKVIKVG